MNPEIARYRIPVAIRGQHFPSICAAALALNVDQSTVAHALDRGTVDDVGLGLNFRRKRRLCVNGIEYESQAAFARAVNVKQDTIQKIIGRARRIGKQTAVTKWGVMTWASAT